MSDYSAALERAQSRAAVLQSLQDSYGGKTAPQKSTNNAKNDATSKSATVKTTATKNDKITGNNTNVKDAVNTGNSIPANTGSQISSSDKGVVNDMVEVILRAIEDPSMKTRQFFRDSLRGKAIVVENLNMQLDASKSKKRMDL